MTLNTEQSSDVDEMRKYLNVMKQVCYTSTTDTDHLLNNWFLHSINKSFNTVHSPLQAPCVLVSYFT